MRRNHRYYKPLALIMIAIMLCSAMVLQIGISQVQADTENLADKAVTFLKTDYETNGAPRGMAGLGPFDAYVLNAAGVDVSAWQHNSVALPDAVKDLVQQDISNTSGPVKYLAQDLIAMRKMGENSLADQLQTLITNRQNNDGSFQNDSSVYSIIPAYELLGREGSIGIVDSVWAQNYILNAQNGATGAWADFMVTAQAVRALNYLSPGADPNSPVGQAITSGCDWMKQQQSADGSFSAAMDDPLIDAAEAIATQDALGLNPAAAWTNNGKSAVDYLNNDALNADGSFGSSRNVMDATWALYSYKLLGILPTGSGGGGGGGGSSEVSVRVRVEGITSNPVDTTVNVSGTALDALNQAVGSGNVVAPGGFITSINSEAGNAAVNPPTSWFYYAIRNGTIDPVSLSSTPGGYNVADGDQVVFYIGAYEAPPSYAAKTFLPVVSASPQAPTAGQTVTLNISAKKYDWLTGLQDLSGAEATAIGDYTVQAGGTTYTSSFGQIAIPNVTAGTLSYVVINQSSDGYPDVVPYRGSITVGQAANSSVRVRVEGITSTPVDATVSLSGTALDALNQAVGSGNVVAPGGFITSINGESGLAGVAANTDTSWFYYVIRNGIIDPVALSSTPGGYNIADGDQVVFYIGAYEAPPSYAAKTFFPVVSASPQAPTAGQTVTLNISAKKNDWLTGLQDLSGAEATAIGDYTVQAGGTTYTSSFGQIAIPNLTAGTLSYVVTNQSSDGYPDVVPYRGSINIAAGAGGGSGGSSLSCSPGIQVVGKNGEGLFGPTNVTVYSSNTWGLTALGALDATGLSYTMSPTWAGFVDSIAGQASTGTTGWMYTVNGSSPLVLAKDYPISSEDRIVWYFSNSMDQEAPIYGQPGSGGGVGASNQQAATSTTGNATVYPAAGGKIGLGDDASIDIPPDALNGTEGLDVSIQKVGSPPLAPEGFRLLGYAFEFTIGGLSSYKFNKPVTLTFSFDPAALPEGQKPSVYYYDAASSKWVDLGGTINGGTITVSVDHLTRFALIIKETDFPQANPQYFQFVDVPASFWASDAIMKIYRLGYVNGYPDGTFKPENQITRAEFVSILDKVLNLSNYSPAVPDFSDVASEDWFYQAVENAVHAGIIRGYGSIFGPDRQVTREEVAVILVNALGKQDEAKACTGEKTSFTDDASISDWARGFVVVAVKHGLIGGYPDGEFKAQGSATRAEACAVITNFLNLKI
ncbi:MAG: S-layer homology domain-containing protein [Syntrophomonas sp.]